MSVFSSNKIRRSALGFAALALAVASLLTVPALTRPLEAKVFMEMDAVRHGVDGPLLISCRSPITPPLDPHAGASWQARIDPGRSCPYFVRTS